MRIERVVLGVIAACFGVSAPVWAGQQQPKDERAKSPAPVKVTSQPRPPKKAGEVADMIMRSYQLDDKERNASRTKVTKIASQYQQVVDANSKQLDHLQKQLGQRWQNWMNKARKDGQGGTKPWEDPEFIKLRDRIQDLKRQHENAWEIMIDDVEKVLPPKRVEAARQRRKQWVERWQEWSGGQSVGSPGTPGKAPPLTTAAGASPWEEYTKEVITRHRFDATQVASALAILKDVQDRALAVQRSHDDLQKASAARGDDAKTTAQQTAARDAQLGVLFEELKHRLDGLVTDEQRRKAAANAPAPKPGAGSKPAAKPSGKR